MAKKTPAEKALEKGKKRALKGSLGRKGRASIFDTPCVKKDPSPLPSQQGENLYAGYAGAG